jgi:hypothetical protein
VEASYNIWRRRLAVASTQECHQILANLSRIGATWKTLLGVDTSSFMVLNQLEDGFMRNTGKFLGSMKIWNMAISKTVMHRVLFMQKAAMESIRQELLMNVKAFWRGRYPLAFLSPFFPHQVKSTEVVWVDCGCAPTDTECTAVHAHKHCCTTQDTQLKKKACLVGNQLGIPIGRIYMITVVTHSRIYLRKTVKVLM